MSEESKSGDGGAQSQSGDAVAMSLALSGASRSMADAYLEDQRHHLHKQLKHLDLGIWEKQLGEMLRIATMMMGLLFAGALGWLIWQAANSNGLLVEPFSVPPDLAARGLTGEVVAARVLDRLSLMQSQTNTGRPARSYSNAWGDHGIKMEIPETGISLAELDKWLREKLGHDTRVSGEIVRTETGVAITARASGYGAETVAGLDANIDVLVTRLAESIYRLTQPYRYAVFLLRHENKPAEALPIFKRLALNGDPDDRLWSYNMWAVAAGPSINTETALTMFQRAVATLPDSVGTYENLQGVLSSLGRAEESLATYREMEKHLLNGRQRYVPSDRIADTQRRIHGAMDLAIGAYHDALPVNTDMARTGVPGLVLSGLANRLVGTQIGEHDLAAARAGLENLTPAAAAQQQVVIAFNEEDWPGVLPLADRMAEALKKYPGDQRAIRAVNAPRLAYALARLGRFTEAERVIAPTYGDCYRCLIARAQVAELQDQHAGADAWFARASAAGPSLPFADWEWGKAQLARGQTDAAIAKFREANRRSPHFADALEGWGEALMAKNQSHLALAKFEEAEKYAPNWGRLHLKWGEALGYAGKKDEAKTQFARAAQLDLTPSEKSELSTASRMTPGKQL